MKRLFLVKEGQDLLPYLNPTLNQAGVPKAKLKVLKAGTDLILSFKQGKCLITRADIRKPYRHMVFNMNTPIPDKGLCQIEISCLTTQGLIPNSVEGLDCFQQPGSVNVKTA